MYQIRVQLHSNILIPPAQAWWYCKTCHKDLTKIKIQFITSHNGKAIVIAINKSDLLDKDTKLEIEKSLKTDPMLNGLPCCFISAKNREGIKHLFDNIYRVLENVKKNITTNKLNNILRKALDAKSIPFKGKFRPKIRFVHQGGKNPHVITLHGNSLEKIEGSYRRFLVNFYQKKLDLLGITIKLKFITSKNPYKS